MKRMHVMLPVKDLGEATRFYSGLFDAEPTTRKPDYARWMLDDLRVNFSIAEKDEDFGIEYLGIQAETPDELEELRECIDRTGGIVNNEGETTCCYTNSDKTWVVDQQGVSWEAFYTSGDADSYYAGERTRASDERRLRFSEVAGAVGPRPALRLLRRVQTSS